MTVHRSSQADVINGWEKMDMSLAAGTLTITPNGLTRVVMPSVTGGLNVELDLTGRTFYFNDDSHGSSHLTDLGFGLVEAVDWAQDVPFFVYLVNEDDTSANVGCFITKSPYMQGTPAAAAIHDYDAAGATDDQTSIFGMWNDDAGKAQKPVMLIGCLRMRWSTTTDDWTVQALSAATDGIGYSALDKIFANKWTMPVAQNGAAAGAYCTDNGGTAPAGSSDQVQYVLKKNGYYDLYARIIGGDPNGAGAVTMQIATPYANATPTGVDVPGVGSGVVSITGTGIRGVVPIAANANSYVYFQLATDGSAVQNGSLDDNGDYLTMFATMKAF